jgi:hypothetical protein
MPAYEIPLSGRPQRFAISLSGTPYTLRFQFRKPGAFNTESGDWILDIGDALGTVLVAGIPLLPGHNILEQYDYLGFQGQLWLTTDGTPAAPPTFSGLGSASRLYWVTPPYE